MMGNPFGAVIASGIVGLVGWAFLKKQEQEKLLQPSYEPAIYVQKKSKLDAKSLIAGLLGNALENVDFDMMQGPVMRNAAPQAPQARSGGLSGLLDLIGNTEAPKGYNQVYGGISNRDQPPKPLTQMTVGEVLAWQDSIDPKYRSEAAGRYQFMEDTLRGLVREGKVRSGEKFTAQTQDRLAVDLMKRRGLDGYLRGSTSPQKFANNLAKEWASLPVVTGSKRGRSYYAGDGLNHALVSENQILTAIQGAR